MYNEIFYASAATVIPLLLIAIIATRSFRVGEYQDQRIITIAIFGMPVIGEIAAFAFLFFEPIPTFATAILAIGTWIGLISQLGLAVWWLLELIRRDIPDIPDVKAGRAASIESNSEATGITDHEEPAAEEPKRRRDRTFTWACPVCQTINSSEAHSCMACNQPRGRG